MAVYKVVISGGPNNILIAIAMIVVFGGMGIFIYKLLWQPRLNLKRLQSTGIPGKATILEVQDTNISVNNNPQFKLILELKDEFNQQYITSCKTIVRRLQPIYFQPGKEVNVKIDPKNIKNVILDIN